MYLKSHNPVIQELKRFKSPSWFSTSHSNNRPPSLLILPPEKLNSTFLFATGKRSRMGFAVSVFFFIIVQKGFCSVYPKNTDISAIFR